ncbi:hypothetical protein [Nonomuraea cavernae]|uniref:Uncharacterized protein n=1 Tax=Nonomuraea cavernae TaxID=2045107 RepID=A0A917YT69_9ACTN|nr:hypothetical protein [Nonomuraea cavernae]MCA2184310.1 hypothetical protein [Nonomuraea cavernae]GGO64189.1 hypothetical protein GCM10012289_13030 [Nonomuraea cavernae]
MTVQDLRDVLHAHGEGPAPANPVRNEQIQVRIRRIRLRRRLGAGTAVLAIAALGFPLLSGTAEPGPQITTATQPSGPSAASGAAELPERFTSPDGTEYRRLALTAIKRTGSETAKVTIPVTGRPLDVAGICTSGGTTGGSPRVRIDGINMGGYFGPCDKEMRLLPLTLPPGARDRITLTFDAKRSGTACVRADGKGPCEPVKPERAAWTLGVYEWTPPERPVEPKAPRALPRRIDGYSLADSSTGTWPREKSATFRVLGDGRPLGVDQICTGDLADRLWFAYRVNGKDSSSSGSCGVWKKGSFPMAMTTFTVPKGKQVTITVTLRMRGEATNRPVRWSVGLFRR